ncbi:MAG: DUF192 domain-containing protein [Gemmatimonadales bacterium]
MKTLEVRNATRDETLAGRVRLADGWWTRLRGMMGRPEPAEDEGMLLEPCQSVHMYWMKYPLDVAFLAPDGRIVATYHGLAPSRRSKWHRDADRALELRAGRLAATRTEVGDHVELRNAGDDHGTDG